MRTCLANVNLATQLRDIIFLGFDSGEAALNVL
jgi:hypothetical protein